MDTISRFSRAISALLLLTLTAQSALAAEYDLLQKSVNVPRTQAEYYNSNPDRRLTINVNMVSGVQAPGIYHIPDNTDLVTAIGLAGGPGLNGDLTEVQVKRMTPEGYRVLNYDVEKMIATPNLAPPPLNHGDIILVTTHPPASQNWINTLTIVSTIAAIVGSALVIRYTTK